MERLSAILNTTWKRLIAAAVVSAMIIFALSSFAESSYVQTQKVQQESARGQHCQKWSYDKQGDQTTVICAKWPDRKS